VEKRKEKREKRKTEEKGDFAGDWGLALLGKVLGNLPKATFFTLKTVTSYDYDLSITSV